MSHEESNLAKLKQKGKEPRKIPAILNNADEYSIF